MPACTSCKQEFPRLPDNSQCYRCLDCQPNLSSAEIRAVHNKLQCKGCSLVNAGLINPLCNGCVIYYCTSPVPPAIITLPGVVQLLFNDIQLNSAAQPPISDGASILLERASAFQANASSSRIGKPTISSNISTGISNDRFKFPLGPAKLIADRKLKKTEALLQTTGEGARLEATLWKVKLDRDGECCMKELKLYRSVHTFPRTTELKQAFDVLLSKIQKDYSQSYTDAVDLNWSNIAVHIHENSTKSMSLPPSDWNKSIRWLEKEIKTHSLVPLREQSKGIPLQFAYTARSLNIALDSELASSIIPLSEQPKRQKRKRALTTTSATSYPTQSSASQHKRFQQSNIQSSTIDELPTNQVASPADTAITSPQTPPPPPPPTLQGAFRPPQNPQNAEQPILRSAFIPPHVVPKWTRDPPMVAYDFEQIVARVQPDLSVDFYRQPQIKTIEIATDWMAGEETYKLDRAGDAWRETGYIGRGGTKRGIYARFGGREYVLTQPEETDWGRDYVKGILMAEYKLLCQGDALKGHFDEFTTNLGVEGIPKFYFNFKDSIFGEIKGTKSSGGRNVPYPYFIATPLLPCGKTDGGIEKFTGNDEIGSVDNLLTMAIHAFAHFTLVYTSEYLVFCDLQGAYDKDHVMCLIDPQVHSQAPKEERMYWDKGPIYGIETFKKQHLPVCSKNAFCTKLRLLETVVEHVPRKPSTSKHSVEYLINASK